MVPVAFDQETCVLDTPEGMTTEQAAPLSVWRGILENQTPCVISCWKLTVEELEEIKRTGRVYLMVMGMTMPPVHMTVKSPWENK